MNGSPVPSCLIPVFNQGRRSSLETSNGRLPGHRRRIRFGEVNADAATRKSSTHALLENAQADVEEIRECFEKTHAVLTSKI